MRSFSVIVVSLASLLLSGAGRGQECRQLIVGIADNWDSSYVTLTLYEKGDTPRRAIFGLGQKRNEATAGKWDQIGKSWQGRLGRNGLAWGLGRHPVPSGAEVKREGDGRSPAGVFDIGGAWGYEKSIRKHPSLPYCQITSRCLWYEDPESQFYNSFRTIPHEPATESEKKAQMRQDDDAHSLKLFIAHNGHPSAKPGYGKPGYGSSIFFHIWREDGRKATAGCTTMSERNLRFLISRIDPSKNPRYVLLPKSEYRKARGPWQLP